MTDTVLTRDATASKNNNNTNNVSRANKSNAYDLNSNYKAELLKAGFLGIPDKEEHFPKIIN